MTTNINALVIGIIGEQFKLYMMVPQRSREAPKPPEGILVSFPASIPE